MRRPRIGRRGRSVSNGTRRVARSKPTKVVAHEVHAEIDEDRLVVSGRAVDDRPVEAVLFRVRESGDAWEVPTDGATAFRVVTELPATLASVPATVDVRLRLRTPDGSVAEPRLNVDSGEPADVLSPFRVSADRAFWWYVTKDQALSLRVARARRPKIEPERVRVDPRPGGFRFSADLTIAQVFAPRVALEATVRATDHVARLPIEVTDCERGFGSRKLRCRVSGEVDLGALVAGGLPAGEQALDVALVVESEDGTYLRHGLRLAEDPTAVRRLAPVVHTAGERTEVLVPFTTFRSGNLAFAREQFSTDAWRYLVRLRRLGPLWSLIRIFSRVWIVGETPYKAQDVGFHFFRWMRRHHPNRPVYYVVDAQTPERRNVEPLGHVLTHRSREHIRACFLARRFATTHSAAFVLATSDPRAVRWMRGNRVFLQHGVLGTKNMTSTYGRRSPAFHTDFVHVSSERERELMINDLAYRPRQVRVTGLARFDALLEPPERRPEGLLVIPTWRDWLLRPAVFAESEFLERWRAFLTSEPLRQAIADGLRVTVILHPNMRFFGSALQVDGVTVLGQGDVDVQSLMRDHAAMVTDYSSVGFDFSFLGRPVFYHQFDRSRFLGPRPSHLDLDVDLPGEVVTDADELARKVVDAWRGGFVQDPEHARRSRRFLDPAEGSYAQQVYESVRTARSVRVPWWRLCDSAFGRRVYDGFRHSELYPSAMRALGWIGRRLPRRDLVVFESNVGRSAADSPRAIYEELVDRGTDLELVWSTRSTFRPRDPRTRKVEPGSPRFHWLLSRARYWVNNQNFGPQVTPARGTTYLQTWHGTPLKRMQFDAVSTQGRDAGYLERVARKTATWSILLSPSDYATEAFRSAFRYEGPVLQVGYPRNDVLVNDPVGVGALTRRRLGLPQDARVILYAPTFRDDVKRDDRFVWDVDIDWAALVAPLDEDTHILVRRHDIVRGSLGIPPELADRIVNVSSYPDVQELLCAADVLITDYSSVMFDYAILDRPIVLFCYDLDHYRDELRGFYLDFEAEAPGPIVTTQAELEAALAAAQRDGDRAHADCRRAFRERYAPLDDGRAAQRVVDEVFGRA